MYFTHVDGKKRRAIIVNCQYCCNLIACRHDRPRQFCSNECHYASKRIPVICAYCECTFLKKKSSLAGSRSGLFFCCREHKDLAQRTSSGILKIDHYKNGNSSYRRDGLEEYGELCNKCGFDDIRCLDVHHIDANRENNKIENLIVLCANCHALVTRGHAKISKDRKWNEKT